MNFLDGGTTAELVLAAVFVFVLRMMDVSLDTLRLLFMMRGRKFVAGGIGAIQACLFIVAVAGVLTRPLNPFTVVGYALGFGTGVILGVTIEEWLAFGYAMFRIYSPAHAQEIAAALRASGHAVTEIFAQGKEGRMTVLNCVVKRKDIGAVRDTILNLDPEAFITLDEVRSLQRGFFRGARAEG